MVWRFLAALLLAGCAPRVRAPATPGTPVRGLANIQRSMRLLASDQRVRILFYGQSITESAWSQRVADDLHAKYPNAELENRALGGFSSERLLETADSDLYPWQPDLVIFHVYGAHDKYQELMDRIRARTSAEVLVQTDHITRDEELEESREAGANPPDAEHWSGFMNQVFLPSLVERNQVALCDVRSSWQAFLRERDMHAAELLRDGLHLNERGDERMATFVESCLRYDPSLRSPAEDWVQTFPPKARQTFVGSRVELAVAAGSGSTRVRIDGRAPSELTPRSFARAHVRGAGKWPPVHGIEHKTPLLPELFTFSMKRAGAAFQFALRGAQTGDDGEGRSDASFVSKSGRVVLEASDWDIDYAFELMGLPVPDSFEIDLSVESHAVDEITAGAHTVTVAAGLTPGQHVLELEGDAPVRAITVYRR